MVSSEGKGSRGIHIPLASFARSLHIATISYGKKKTDCLLSQSITAQPKERSLEVLHKRHPMPPPKSDPTPF